MNKPYSESCDQNREPILSVIQPLLKSSKTLLEIGSGTGQHAVYFAKKMPQLNWQTSDRAEYHAGIQQWLAEANLDNVQAPLLLDVLSDQWMSESYDAVFSANTLHIMHHECVQALFDNIANVLNENGLLIIYGPFNYDGNYTSESNARFDIWLKGNDSKSCIKDFEWVNELAEKAGLTLQEDYEMPANNRILCWKRVR